MKKLTKMDNYYIEQLLILGMDDNKLAVFTVNIVYGVMTANQKNRFFEVLGWVIKAHYEGGEK